MTNQSQPPTSENLTIESALAELRSMFKGRQLLSPYISAGFNASTDEVCFVVYYHDGLHAEGATLSEAMSKVRVWVKSGGSEREMKHCEPNTSTESQSLSEADRHALSKLPDNDWFGIDGVSYTVRSPRYRCDRLVEKGILENRVVGDVPHLRTEYRKL